MIISKTQVADILIIAKKWDITVNFQNSSSWMPTDHSSFSSVNEEKISS